MNAKNLRIGNYINVTRSHGRGEKQTSVKKVNLHYLSQLENKSKNITPIPITEKWLIDFGFVNVTDNEYPNYNLGHYTCMWRNGKTNICNNHGFINDLKYVHELQNLYFAVSGRELSLKTKS